MCGGGGWGWGEIGSRKLNGEEREKKKETR